MNDKVTQLHTRDEIEDDLLVADYVAGRLDDDAKAAFEKRLREDDELVARVIEERGFRHGGPDTAGGDVPDASAIAGIRAEIADVGEEPVRRASIWRKSTIAATLVAAAIVVIFMERQSPREEFTTPSDQIIVPVEESQRVRLVFAGDASEEDRIAAGDELGFEVLWGPGPAGAYVVMTEEPMSRDDLAAWHADLRIELAEPVSYEKAP